MEEKLIEFETAKLANLKGFDPITKLKKNSHYNSRTGELDPLGVGAAVVNFHYYAATQSQLQKWLRDVHKIYVLVDMGINRDYHWKYFDDKKPFTYSIGTFNTYEEALEIGLQIALNLI